MRTNDVLTFAVICALLSPLWIINLNIVPYWDWDEGVNMNYAHNLLNGKIQWFSLKYAFIPHPPLYPVILSIIYNLLDESIISTRILSVILSYLTALLLFQIALKLFNQKTAAISSILYLISSHTIYFGRMGFSNNLISTLLSAAFLCMITHEQKAGNWLFISAILLGFSALAGIQPLFIIAVLLAYNILANNKIIPKYIFYALLPSTVFSMYMLATNEYFLGDVIYQLERFGLTSIKVSAAAAVFILLSLFREKIMHEAMHLIKIEKEIILPKSLPHMEKLTMLTLLMVHVLASWELIRPITVETMMSGVNYYWVGVAGLFFFPKKHKTSTLIYLAGLILSVFILDRADHMLIPLYPFFSLGTAVFLQHLYKFLKIHAGVALSILVITAPFCIALYNDISTFALGCCIPQMDIQDIQAVTSYVNSQDEGLTLTMSYTVPYFKNATVVTQSIVYAGYPVAYYPVYPRTRFTDNISYNNAQYIVLPEAVIDWTITYHPEFKEIRNWPKINQSGQYSIYKNPNL